MNWVTLSTGLALGVCVGYAVYDGRRRFRDPAQYLSSAWLQELAQRERQDGIDGPCWQWPVRKSDKETPLALVRRRSA